MQATGKERRKCRNLRRTDAAEELRAFLLEPQSVVVLAELGAQGFDDEIVVVALAES